MIDEKILNVPMVITRGMFVFPGNSFNLEVGRPKSLEAITKAQDEYDDYVFITSQKEPSIDEPSIDDIYKFGTLCKIRIVKTRDRWKHESLIRRYQSCNCNWNHRKRRHVLFKHRNKRR